MAKTICDWSKKILEKEPERLLEVTVNANLYCRKCGRVANTKKVLCKATPFPPSKTKPEENPDFIRSSRLK